MLQKSGEKKRASPLPVKHQKHLFSEVLPYLKAQVVLQMMINKWALACGDCSDESLTSLCLHET